jgi:LPXTG-site transpeptidase (sortase) family protein
MLQDALSKAMAYNNKKFRRVIYNFITGLLVFVFLSLIVYFIGYPLLPEFQEIKNSLYTFSPYNISYKYTVQAFLEISPPDYDRRIKVSGGSDESENSAPSSGSSMEDVGDKSQLELADLEKEDTKLIVPSASIEGSVVVGKTQEAMLDGFWHFPLSSVPEKRGNTVIFGHRFDKIPPETETFYNLDKVDIGDKIYLKQRDNEISYTVVSTRVVGKNDHSVLQNTDDYRLTLITCTPLWTSDRRLVVIAVRDKVSHVV